MPDDTSDAKENSAKQKQTDTLHQCIGGCVVVSGYLLVIGLLILAGLYPNTKFSSLLWFLAIALFPFLFFGLAANLLYGSITDLIVAKLKRWRNKAEAQPKDDDEK